MQLLSIFLLLFCLTITQGAKILCFFPNLSRSHAIVPLSIADELAARGHNVTVITVNKLGSEESHFNEIVIPVKTWDNKFFKSLIDGDFSTLSSKFYFLKTAGHLYLDTATEVIETPVFQKIMREENFDLAFFITVYYNGVQLGVADHFKVPYIAYSPLGEHVFHLGFTGQHVFPATVPSKYYEIVGPMNFYQRIVNSWYLMAEWGFSVYFDGVQAKRYRKVFPNNSRGFYEMKKNASILFLNGHISESNVIKPMLPNVIEVGGVQIQENPKALVHEVQQWLDHATEGAIVWTFGSNLPISMINPKKVEIMFRVLARKKQRVLLKWEKDPRSLPKNFKGMKWIQQDSALAHPNVKLFIGHGGAGGAMEAMFYQVPMFGIPFFSDQDFNVMQAKADGWALGMKIVDITEKNFEEAITQLLENPKYQNRVIELSEIYKDRITSPLDTAVFWSEYVLRHHGAPNLSYPGKHMSWFEITSLDVILVLIALVSIPFLLIWLLIRKLSGHKQKTE